MYYFHSAKELNSDVALIFRYRGKEFFMYLSDWNAMHSLFGAHLSYDHRGSVRLTPETRLKEVSEIPKDEYVSFEPFLSEPVEGKNYLE